ncbi:hypothetical protein EON65_21335 [archaeon]|nr:MAG: hypothetical protein EON65_21335 [archaeon]
MNIVNLALTLEEQTNVLRAMKVLVDSQSSSSSSLIDNLDKLRDIYLQLVNQRYERLLKKRRFEAAEIKQEQLPALSSTALPTSASIPVSLNSKVGSDTGSGGLQLNSGVQKEAKTSQLAFGSSRAQYMLQRVQGASVAAAAARNPSMMAKIEQISDFSMGSQLKPSGSGVTGPSSGQYISATSKLQCCVCKETAEKPCAAKCGHICCQECWTRCLQIKPMCPYCRAPTTKDSISKLLVRASTS